MHEPKIGVELIVIVFIYAPCAMKLFRRIELIVENFLYLQWLVLVSLPPNMTI